ncbi:MAG: oligopeptide transporter, OPT family [Myxococcota bacterium]
MAKEGNGGTEGSGFTLRAIVLGVLLSITMLAANMYLGLKAGMTISANIPCSVIAIIVFGTILRSRSISEVNVAQATGSVGEGMAAGIIFLFPSLVMSGAFVDYSQWGLKEYGTVTLAVLAGSVLGVVITGFLRKPMVVDTKELRFPEGVATAEILKTGMAAITEGKHDNTIGVAIAFAGGFLVKILSSGVALFQETVTTVFRAGGATFKLGSDISPALVGVGFIIEFNGAVLVAGGGALAWFIFIPIYTALHPMAGDDIAAIADGVWKSQIRYIGVGGMIVGGLWSIVQTRKQLAQGIKAALVGITGGKSSDEGGDDLSMKFVWALIGIACLVAVGVYFLNVGMGAAMISSAYTLLAVFFFVAISVYIVGLIGSTNQPVSGITICTFLLASLFLYAGHITGDEAVKSVLLIAGVVCLSACLSGTSAQNFKTGLLVGGSARALQGGLLIAVTISSMLAVPLLIFLNKAFVIGSAKLPAPQAGMFADLARGLFSEGATLPWNMVGIGLGLSVVLIVIGQVLKRAGSGFGISPMAVAVGIYLPFTTTLPIFIGGLIHLVLTRREKDPVALVAKIQKGTIICAGLIAGEAITAVVLAIPIGLGAGLPWMLIQSDILRSVLSMAVLAALPVLIYRSMRK